MDPFPERSSTSTWMFYCVVYPNNSSIFRHRPNISFSSNATWISVRISFFGCPPLVELRSFADFSSICAIQRNQRQLKGRDVALRRIDEIDVATIKPSNPDVPIDMKLFDDIRDEIFCYTVEQVSTISVEFLHRDVMKRWLTKRDEIETKFSVTIRPQVSFNDQHDTSSSESDSAEIRLPYHFAMVIDHPTFGREFRDFIRKSITKVFLSIHLPFV